MSNVKQLTKQALTVRADLNGMLPVLPAQSEVTLRLNGGGNLIFGEVTAQDEDTCQVRTHLGTASYCRHSGRCLEASHGSLGNYRLAEQDVTGGSHLVCLSISAEERAS